MSRVYNFNAGPSTLPLPVLEHAQQEFVEYQGAGMSVMEMSHRSPEYQALNEEAEARTKRLLNIGDDYRVLFLQGGASLQFAMVPMNILPSGGTADYLMTGSWSEKAHKEASGLGNVHIAATTKEETYCRIPRQEEIQLSNSPTYVHITSNNTIFGTQWHQFPNVGDAPLVADMSSDIMSRPMDVKPFGIIYAGAQKNLGPSGVTMVIIRQSLIDQTPNNVPVILKYATHAKSDSLYNTPPSFSVYMLNLVLKWIEDQGGLSAMAEHNQKKAKIIYDAIDNSGGFYRPHAAHDSRSLMNITYRLGNEDLEKLFVSEAKKEGFVGLKGHRSVGGIRASIYNAMTVEGCQALASFMGTFAKQHG